MKSLLPIDCDSGAAGKRAGQNAAQQSVGSLDEGPDYIWGEGGSVLSTLGGCTGLEGAC